MELTTVIAIAASLVIIPSLIAGAYSDYKTRTFPKEYWRWTAPVGGFVTIFLYLIMIADGLWMIPMFLIIISVVVSIVCYYMGLNFGSGGDWRALIYISLITPWLIVATVVASVIVGGVLAIFSLVRKDNPDPLMFRNIPFAVAILIGYFVASGAFIITNLNNL
jgi:hypothetical protein